jgi:sulfoxide reductase heme-binding subunit YedZ
MAFRLATGTLGADPIAVALNQLGLLALALLVGSLACTPIRLLGGPASIGRLRKHLGLLGFGYAALHTGVYLVADQGLSLAAVAADVVKRPFVTVGALAVALLVPLAITSTAAMQRRLGGPRWRRLHKLAYLSAALGVLHFVLRVKADVTEPLVFAGLLAVLFLVRVAARAARASAT